MKIGGELKVYYDVLDEMGVIEPLLQKDWNVLATLKTAREQDFLNLVTTLNSMSSEKQEIKKTLVSYDAQLIQFFAMEVAKEFAEFQKNKQYH